ncbi:hypothetical protein ACO2WH_28625, partial [Escherichia coli]|uniref:hypothetical protein n=1 Tax=Escherichia coli TaxID=562 RepID=UPI003BFD414A
GGGGLEYQPPKQCFCFDGGFGTQKNTKTKKKKHKKKKIKKKILLLNKNKSIIFDVKRLNQT